MLSCKDISRQASDYQDKHLSRRERLGFAFHLLMCGNCRAFVAQMKKATKLYNGLATKTLELEQAESLSAKIISQAQEQGGSLEKNIDDS